jgi:hypothetical protein
MHGYNYSLIGTHRDGVKKFNGNNQKWNNNKYTSAVSSRRGGEGGKILAMGK